MRTLLRFCAILGSVAGDFALILWRAGWIFIIAGGIAPSNLSVLEKSDFRARFEAKGRFQSYLAAIPTYVILDRYAAFLGAADSARQSGTLPNKQTRIAARWGRTRNVGCACKHDPPHRAVCGGLFFIWGFATVLNDTLIPKLKGLFELTYTEVMLTQFCFFLGYFFFSIPAGLLLSRVGYVRGIVVGLS